MNNFDIEPGYLYRLYRRGFGQNIPGMGTEWGSRGESSEVKIRIHFFMQKLSFYIYMKGYIRVIGMRKVIK